MIKIKRVYEEVDLATDGKRFLVDRLWPRGKSKESLQIVAWLKAASPSNELRHWYGHDPAKWEEFQRRYGAELDAVPEAWAPLLEAAREGDITLLYSSKEIQINNAAALKIYLEDQLSKLS
jgi:uncharacterized protein YeaO (DUF488 family)